MTHQFVDNLEDVCFGCFDLVFIADDGDLVRHTRAVSLWQLNLHVVGLPDFVDLRPFLPDDVWMVTRLHAHRHTEVPQFLMQKNPPVNLLPFAKPLCFAKPLPFAKPLLLLNFPPFASSRQGKHTYCYFLYSGAVVLVI